MAASSNGRVKVIRRKIGDEMVSANGYTYLYVDDGKGQPIRMLKHHVIALKKYGRPPTALERVAFEDNDRTNFDPDNIIYIERASPRAALKRRQASLEDRIREATAELEEVNKALRDLK